MNAIIFTVICMLMPHVMAQNAPQDGENRDGVAMERRMRGPGGPGGPGGRFGGGGGSEEERAQWRERMEKYRNASPAERRTCALRAWSK